VSVVDLPMAAGGPAEEFGRTPPQDVSAEQSVLGGMMLSKDAIADVVEVLRSNDFYRPAHELIYEAVLDPRTPSPMSWRSCGATTSTAPRMS